MKRAILILSAVLVLLAAGHLFACLVIRQRLRPLPADPAGVARAARAVFGMKCAACHDSDCRLPFYAKLPLVGDAVRSDALRARLHWEPFECRAAKAPAAVNLASLAKLGYALGDRSMPPRAYRLGHWGTAVTPSETAILRRWILDSRAAWLKRWGIASGAEGTLQALPASLPADPAAAALGRRLFNDTRLSGDGTVSCATCHDFAKGATDNLPVSTGVGGKRGGVNAPTAFNAVFNIRQFWDGRAADLAEQAGGPPLNPVEMASRDWAQITAKLDADAPFKAAFAAVYPEGFTARSVCAAIAEYEKNLLTPGSAFDRHLRGEKNALTPARLRGLAAFRARRCDACHVGPTLGGQSFERPDLAADFFAGRPLTDEDSGLKEFTKDPRDDRRFKVPSLRVAALTAPYMHDASCATLPEAVAKMLRCTAGAGEPDPAETAAIADFIGALAGSIPEK